MLSITVGAFNREAAVFVGRMRATARNTPRRAGTHGCLVVETLALEALNGRRNPLFRTEKVPPKPQTMGQKISPLVDVIQYDLD